MAIITVYPWSYYNEKQGIREMGEGLVTEDTIARMGDKVRDPKIDINAAKHVDDSELTQSGRYYEKNKNNG